MKQTDITTNSNFLSFNKNKGKLGINLDEISGLSLLNNIYIEPQKYFSINTNETTATNSKVHILESRIIESENVNNWSTVFSNIRDLEAKYGLSSKDFRKAYYTGKNEILENIDKNEREEWLRLCDLYFF